jgi:signal peptidase I
MAMSQKHSPPGAVPGEPGPEEPERGEPDAEEPGPGQPGPAAASDATPATSAGGGRRRSRSIWRELPVLIVAALVVALLIKSFVVQAFYIPSGSMENTLQVGDKILVNKLVYHFRPIKAGDIIVFNGVGSWNSSPPSRPATNPVAKVYDVTLRPLFHSIAGLFGTPVGQTDYIKRVIGVPGDHVACCNSRGQVTVNGVALHERSYIFPGDAPSQQRFSITVPPGRLWVMGDHRDDSDDSRLRQSRPGRGTIPESKVTGRAFVIVWPVSRWRFLPIPDTFGQPGVARGAAALPGAVIRPAPSYLPLAGGLAFAVPLTWLQRRVRRRPRSAATRGPWRRR